MFLLHSRLTILSFTERGGSPVKCNGLGGDDEGIQYVYSIRSVDSEGHKSPFDNI
jgi:hypothetical protein